MEINIFKNLFKSEKEADDQDSYKKSLRNQEDSFSRNSNSPESPGRRKFLKTALKTGGAAVVASSGLGYFYGHKKGTEELNEINKQEEDFDSMDDDLQLNEDSTLQKEEVRNTEVYDRVGKLNQFAVEAYYNLEKNEKYFPPDLMPDNFFSAVEIRESAGRVDAVSNKGAVGLMQNTEISIRDIFQYFYLNRSDYSYTKELGEVDEEDAKKIQNYIKNDPELARIYGKLFFMVLFKKYDVGKNDYLRAKNLKNKIYDNSFKENKYKGHIRESRLRLLGCYNGGLRRKEQEIGAWPKESRDYAYKVENYIKRLNNIDKKILNNGLENFVDNEMKKKIAIRMDYFKKSEDRYFMLKEYIKKIKEKIKQNNNLAIDDVERILEARVRA